MALPVAFEYPSALWLLALLPAAAFIASRSVAEMSPFRRQLTLGLRLGLMSLFILSLAGVQSVRSNNSVCALFLLDFSDSVTQEERRRAIEFINQATEHMRREDKAGVIVFGEDAHVENLPSPRLQVKTIETRPASGHTDIAGAIRLALATFDEGSSKQCVLLTDGNENLGRALEEAVIAQANDVRLDVLPLSAEREQEALLERLVVPMQAKLGEPFEMEIIVRAKQPTSGKLVFFRNEDCLGEAPVKLSPGKNVFQRTEMIEQPGFYNFRVHLDADTDTLPGNNDARGFTRVTGEPKVLYIEQRPEDARFVARALEGAHIRCSVVGPNAIPTRLEEFAEYDGIVLSDINAVRFTARQMQIAEAAIRDLGVGLGMVGGENSFGLGGYYKTPIERALPVSMDVKHKEHFPGTAVCIVVDQSGSMEALEDGVPKIEMANMAACLVVDLLSPKDEISVIATDTEAKFVVNLTKVSEKEHLKQEIKRLRGGGGGIFVYTGIHTAYEVLKRSNSRVRHIILLADGSDSEQQEGCVELASRMAGEKITLTVVSIGRGCHTPFLEELAKAGKGRLYVVEKMAELPRIYTRETFLVARSLVVEEPFFPTVDAADESLRGVDWRGVPPLLGYVGTTAKPAARQPMLTHKGDPLFARWRYGLGKAIAFTSDAKNRWAAQWLSWSQFSKIWAQIIRWSLRPAEPGDFETTVAIDRGVGEITVDAVGSGDEFVNALEIEARLTRPDLSSRDLKLVQVGPGRYRQTFDARQVGSYIVNISYTNAQGEEVHQTAGAVVPYPDEYRDLETNSYLLSQLAELGGGEVLQPKDAQHLFSRHRQVTRSPTPLWPLLVLIGALLFPLDIAARRIAIEREQVAAAWEKVGELRLRLRRDREVVTPPTVGALLEAKRRAAAEFSPSASVEAELPAQPQAPAAPSVEGAPAVAQAVEQLQQAMAQAPEPPREAKAAPPEAADTFARLRKAKRRAHEKDDR